MSSIAGRFTSVPFPTFLAEYLTNTKPRSIPLSEIVYSYEKETGRKLSKVAYIKALRKAVNKLQTFRIERHEQLWLFPLDKQTNSMYTLNKVNQHHKRIHSAHKIKLSISYRGEQPIEGADTVKPFGRYGTATQAIFKLENITIVTFKKKLNVWIHNPPGVLTQEQMINARVEGHVTLVQFARAYNLKLTGYLNKVLLSHHVTENKALNALLRPLVKKYEKDIYQRLGTKVCDTSHKGKVEHEGKKRDDGTIAKGEDVAKGFEKLALETPKTVDKIHDTLENKFYTALENYDAKLDKYSANIELHMAVMRDMRTTLKAIRTSIKK